MHGLRSLFVGLLTAAVVTLSAGLALADETKSCGSSDFVQQTIGDESSGNYSAVNTKGFLGAYQIGEAKLVDMGYAIHDGDAYDNNIRWAGKDGILSTEDFLASKEVQDKAFWNVKEIDWGTIKRLNLQQYVGRQMPDGTVVTESSLLHGCHLACDKIKAYFDGGMSCSRGAQDGYGTCVEKYLKNGAGFDVSNVTGGEGQYGSCSAPASKPYDGSTQSRTCAPTVQMLGSIPCGQYPPSLRSFCSRYAPLQMNMSECRDAESYAEKAPPSGRHLEACKQQTFGTGTGSWSYVLACAKAEPAAGSTGESRRTVGNGDDPACYERLKARGIEFNALGPKDVSAGGRTCVIPNAVSYKGQAVPLSQTVTLNCALVEQLEDYGQAMAGRGVTEMSVLGTISCRGINNTNVINGAKTSLHGFGNAIDINGFTVNGAMVKTSDYFGADIVKKTFLEEAQAVACTKFDGTLGFKTYKGKWTHLHFQATERTSCDGVR